MTKRRKAVFRTIALYLVLMLVFVGGTGCKKTDSAENPSGQTKDQETLEPGNNIGDGKTPGDNTVSFGAVTGTREEENENEGTPVSEPEQGGQTAENQIGFSDGKNSGNQEQPEEPKQPEESKQPEGPEQTQEPDPEDDGWTRYY